MNKKQKRLALIASVFTVTALATVLVLTALKSSVAYFYTPSELAAALADPENTPTGLIRLGGLVAAGSVTHADGPDAIVQFTIEDQNETTRVTFAGILPDLFREGQGVVVQGKLEPGGTVKAIEVLAKHDETYMPREVAEALKEQGHWRDDDEAGPQ